MKKLAAVLLAALMLTGCSADTPQSSGPLTPDQVFSGGTPNIDIEGYQRPSSMLNLSSQQIVMNMRIGWNLGYSLESCFSNVVGDYIPDVVPGDWQTIDETFWGNPAISEKLFWQLTDSGVNAVRLPITWREHIDEAGNIDEDWLNRVQQVVDYAYNCGMYVIITVYHDGANDNDAWIRSAVNDFRGTLSRYTNLWSQIAERFRSYNERLLFESMNEVEFLGAGKDRAYEILNSFNQSFLDTVRTNGGNNIYRHLLIAGYNASITDTCDKRFQMPDDPANHSILSVHYYTPKTFCRASIQNYWGNKSDQDWMEHQISSLRTNFIDNGIPVIITEYGAKGSDTASRVFFCEKLTKLCRDNFMSTFLWDDGSEFDRTAFTWQTPELIQALKRATSGNSYVPKKLDSIDKQSEEAPAAISETTEAAVSTETAEASGTEPPQDSPEQTDPTDEAVEVTAETFQSLSR